MSAYFRIKIAISAMLCCLLALTVVITSIALILERKGVKQNCIVIVCSCVSSAFLLAMAHILIDVLK